jgi:hypothetical protein
MRPVRRLAAVLGLLGIVGLPASSDAGPVGSVFVSGHDSDFHALNGNTVGAQHIIQRGLDFVRNGDDRPILFIQTNLDNLGLGDHLNSESGLQASGYTPGTTNGNHYVKVTAAQFATADLSQYSSIFVPSDHGGTLTGTDLNALNARSNDILNYLNAGGGLLALSEDGFRTGPPAQNFGFLPFLVTSAPMGEFENGNMLTPFGLTLGLVNSDINGNFSHNIFTATGGLGVVDVDATGEILTLGGRGQFGTGGMTPEPGGLALSGIGILGLFGYGWLRRRRARVRPRGHRQQPTLAEKGTP